MKKGRTALLITSTALSMLAIAHAQGSIAAQSGRRGDGWVYALAGFTSEFGALELGTGKFYPIGPAAGMGLVQGPGKLLLTLAPTGKMNAIDPTVGAPFEIGDTGLGDCSVPGTFAPNCANAMGRLGGHLYATDFDNNLYAVDPKTFVATLIGPTLMPPLPFTPQSTNADGTLNVYGESFVEYRGKLYATFSTVIIDFEAGTFTGSGFLYRIDPSTALATLIAPLDPNITAMVNVNDTVYGFDAWTGGVLTINMATGETSRPISIVDPAAGSLIAGASPVHSFPARARDGRR